MIFKINCYRTKRVLSCVLRRKGCSHSNLSFRYLIFDFFLFLIHLTKEGRLRSPISLVQMVENFFTSKFPEKFFGFPAEFSC